MATSEQKTAETYTLHGVCANCGAQHACTYPKGKVAYPKLCPSCETNNLRPVRGWGR